MNFKNHVCICNEGCLIEKTQSVFSVYGAKTNYQLQNPTGKVISKYIVDDCILANLNQQEKCDYFFVVKNGVKEDGYFIELKGGDVSKAIGQLASSVKLLKDSLSGALLGRIVCSKFPKAPATFGSNTYIRLRKLLKDNLIIKVGQLSETI